MTASCIHGTEKLSPSIPDSARMLFTALYDRSSPSPSPMMDPRTETKDDSSRKLRAIIPLLYPIARITPMC